MRGRIEFSFPHSREGIVLIYVFARPRSSVAGRGVVGVYIGAHIWCLVQLLLARPNLRRLVRTSERRPFIARAGNLLFGYT